MAQSGGLTCGEDQPAGQLGLRLRRVLILFEDNCARICRLCAIAEDPAGVAVLLEPVRTRAPNRQRIHRSLPSEEFIEFSHDMYIIRKFYKLFRRKRAVYTERTADFYFRDFRRALKRDEDSARECDRSFKINGVEDPSETPLERRVHLRIVVRRKISNADKKRQ